jgi:hypothetical protein
MECGGWAPWAGRPCRGHPPPRCHHLCLFMKALHQHNMLLRKFWVSGNSLIAFMSLSFTLRFVFLVYSRMAGSDHKWSCACLLLDKRCVPLFFSGSPSPPPASLSLSLISRLTSNSPSHASVHRCIETNMLSQRICTLATTYTFLCMLSSRVDLLVAGKKDLCCGL